MHWFIWSQKFLSQFVPFYLFSTYCFSVMRLSVLIGRITSLADRPSVRPSVCPVQTPNSKTAYNTHRENIVHCRCAALWRKLA